MNSNVKRPFEIPKETPSLTGHVLIIGRTREGMSFNSKDFSHLTLSTCLTDGAALALQRMRNLGIQISSSNPSALQEATPEFTKSIVSQCTSTLRIKP